MNDADRQSAAFFEARYQASRDPWQFDTSPYELERYQAILQALSKQTYERGFEPACSIGVLTEELARRVKQLTACDISDTAVVRAKERCRRFEHVRIFCGDVAAELPDGTFDLIVFSELGYYFSAESLRVLVQRLVGHLEPEGEFVAVHWLGRSADHVLHGDDVHQVLYHALPWELLSTARHAGYRIDSWRRPS